MSFDGTEGSSVSLNDAGEWTGAWRSSFPNDLKGQFFGKEILEEILDQRNCVGIRIYHAIKSGKKIFVLVGVNSNENDLAGATEIIANLGISCPPTCGNSNDLNS